MRNLPYRIGSDRTDTFKGAKLLLELGKLLMELACHKKGLALGPSRKVDEILASIEEKQKEIAEHFEANHRSPMRKYVRHGDRPTEIDPRLCRILGLLAAYHVLESRSTVSIMALAANASLTENPAEILETRRLAACMCVPDNRGIHIIQPTGDNYLPEMALGGAVLEDLLGKKCIPILHDTLLHEIKLEKNRRFCSLGGRSRRATAASRRGRDDELASFVRGLPDTTPAELDELVRQRGYIGQDRARRGVCLAVARHIARIKSIHGDGIDPSSLPPRENLLLHGPTGSGKTHLLTLISDIVGLPTLLEDITRYTETGYHGEDVCSILSRLVVEAGSPAVAGISLCCLDEIDKISSGGALKQYHAMVSRDGVMRSLLRLLDGCTLDVPEGPSRRDLFGNRVKVDTTGILWAAAGAFEGLTSGRGRPAIGFDDAREPDTPGIQTEDFIRYGFGRQILARFHLTYSFSELTPEELRMILDRNLLASYEAELAGAHIELRIEDGVRDLLVAEAVGKKTGARGMQSALVDKLQDACFEAYSDERVRTVTLHVESGEVCWSLGRRRRRGKRKAESP